MPHLTENDHLQLFFLAKCRTNPLFYSLIRHKQDLKNVLEVLKTALFTFTKSKFMVFSPKSPKLIGFICDSSL